MLVIFLAVLNRDPLINNIGIAASQQAIFSKHELIAYISGLIEYLSPTLGKNWQSIREQLIKYYVNAERKSTNYRFLRLYTEFTSDFLFNLPALEWSRAHAELNNRQTYFYINEYFNSEQFVAETPLQGKRNQ